MRHLRPTRFDHWTHGTGIEAEIAPDGKAYANRPYPPWWEYPEIIAEWKQWRLDHHLIFGDPDDSPGTRRDDKLITFRFLGLDMDAWVADRTAGKAVTGWANLDLQPTGPFFPVDDDPMDATLSVGPREDARPNYTGQPPAVGPVLSTMATYWTLFNSFMPWAGARNMFTASTASSAPEGMSIDYDFPDRQSTGANGDEDTFHRVFVSGDVFVRAATNTWLDGQDAMQLLELYENMSLGVATGFVPAQTANSFMHVFAMSLMSTGVHPDGSPALECRAPSATGGVVGAGSEGAPAACAALALRAVDDTATVFDKWRHEHWFDPNALKFAVRNICARTPDAPACACVLRAVGVPSPAPYPSPSAVAAGLRNAYIAVVDGVADAARQRWASSGDEVATIASEGARARADASSGCWFGPCGEDGGGFAMPDLEEVRAAGGAVVARPKCGTEAGGECGAIAFAPPAELSEPGLLSSRCPGAGPDEKGALAEELKVLEPHLLRIGQCPTPRAEVVGFERAPDLTLAAVVRDPLLTTGSTWVVIAAGVGVLALLALVGLVVAAAVSARKASLDGGEEEEEEEK